MDKRAGNRQMWSDLAQAGSCFMKAGITASGMVTGINAEGAANVVAGTADVSNHDYSSGSTPQTSSTKTNSAQNKCRRCGGTGNCEPTSGGSRKNDCHGSGLCGYCQGTGWIKAGSSEANCTACNGKGKCKTCKGTGKCPECHGKG